LHSKQFFQENIFYKQDGNYKVNIFNMSNSMSLIALITSKITTKRCIDGTATYRPNPNKYKHFDFKVFIGSNYDIHSFEEGDLVMFSGKFAHRKDHINPMFVCIVIKICK
jgi:hypothetical protein